MLSAPVPGAPPILMPAPWAGPPSRPPSVGPGGGDPSTLFTFPRGPIQPQYPDLKLVSPNTQGPLALRLEKSEELVRQLTAVIRAG